MSEQHFWDTGRVVRDTWETGDINPSATLITPPLLTFDRLIGLFVSLSTRRHEANLYKDVTLFEMKAEIKA